MAQQSPQEHHTHKERFKRISDRNLRKIPFRQRFDPIWGFLVVFVISAIVCGAIATDIMLWQLNQFDLAPVRLLDDDRILTNAYDDPDHLFLDAVQHIADNRIYISQEEGTFHSLDMRTRLWRTEQAFTDDDLLNPNFTRLKSGCGNVTTIPSDCTVRDIIWALSEDNGLAQYRDGQWDVLVTNTAFIDGNGQPVESTALTTASISDDEEWLLLGTLSQGIGLYNLNIRQWVDTSDTYEVFQDRTINHIVYWRDRFWVGTDTGLIEVGISSDEAEAKPLDSISGTILDLEADHINPNVGDDALWVFEERDCIETRTACYWLGKFTNPDNPPIPLIDERNFYGEFNLQRVNFVQQSDNRLIFSGEVGIFSYHDVTHSWQKLFPHPITAVLPKTTDDGFYFAYRNGNAYGVGLVENGLIRQDWTERFDEDVVELKFGQNNDLLVLTQNQTRLKSLHTLSRDTGTVNVLYESESTAYSPQSFTRAIRSGDLVLLVGNDGATLHHMQNRTYDDFNRNDIPDWMINAQFELSVQNTVFLFDRSGGQVDTQIYAIEASNLADPDYIRNGGLYGITPQVVAGEVRSYWEWNTDSIGIIDGNRDIHIITSNQRIRAGGQSEPALASGFPSDVAQFGDELAFTKDKSVYLYDLETRQWNNVALQIADNDQAVELTVSDNTLYARTLRGQLFDSLGNHTIGMTTPFAFNDQSMSDAWQDDSNYYLAGNRSVAKYSAESRDVLQTWTLENSTLQVDIKGVLNDVPLTQSNNNAYLGSQRLNNIDETVQTVSHDSNYIWTVRENNSSRYLVRENLNGDNAQCYYRNPTADANTSQILDAREILAQNIAVTTNTGVKFYSTEAHSWYDAVNAIPAQNVYVLDNYLLLSRTDNTETTLQFVQLNDINFPDSCSSEGVILNNFESITVRGFSADETGGRVVWVTLDGAVEEWVLGTTTEILSAPTSIDSTTSLRHVFDRQSFGYLYVTDDRTLWRYWLDDRRWESISIATAIDIAHINIESDGTTDIVTLTASDGSAYYSELASDDLTIVADPIAYTQGNQGIVSLNNAESLIDVQVRDGDWAFVMPDGLHYLDPDSREWETATIPVDESVQLQDVFSRSILTTNQGQTWWVASQDSLRPTSFVPYNLTATDTFTGIDDSGGVWRWASDGSIQYCEQAITEYTCAIIYTPFTIDSTSIKRAHVWQGQVLFETTTGIRLFNRNTGKETAIDGLSTVTNISFVRETPNHLLLFADDSTVYLLDNQLGLTIYQPNDVVIDSLSNVFLMFDNEWLYYSADGFRQYLVPSSIARYFARNGQPLTAIGNDNIPLRWVVNQFIADEFPLPASVIAPQVDMIVPGTQGDWWVFDNGRVDHFVQQQCNLTTCFVNAGGANISLEIPTLATPIDADTLDVLYPNGTGYRVRADDVQPAIVTPPAQTSIDMWGTLQTELIALPNGAFGFDPLQSVYRNPEGKLESMSYSGRVDTWSDTIATTAEFSQGAPLDVGWLRWERTSKTFVVQTNQGDVTYTPSELFNNGTLIASPVDAVLLPNPQQILTANQYGVWRFTDPNLSLNDPTLTYFPIGLDGAIRASHGQFLTDTQQVMIQGDMLIQEASQPITTTIGDVQFAEDVSHAVMSATINVNGNPVNALGTNGFVWDNNRRHVAYVGDEIHLQSDAGIQVLGSRLSRFDGGLNNIALTNAKLISIDGGLYLDDNDTWYQFLNGSWQPATNPNLSRSWVNNSTWQWGIQSGNVSVGLNGSSHNFGLSTQPLGFTSDILQSAGSNGDTLLISTEAFLLDVQNTTDIDGSQTIRHPAITTDTFESFHFADGSTRLIHYSGGVASEWNGSQFQNVVADPALQRDLLTTDRLRFIWSNNQVNKSIRLDDLNGNPTWADLFFDNGRFPFDVVTSLTAFDNQLLVGTASGLQTYDATSTPSLDNMQALIDMRSNPTTPPATVRLSGIPLSNIDIVMVQSDFTCIQRQIGQPSFVTCADASQLNTRMRVQNNYWQWVLRGNNPPEGRYFNNTMIYDNQLVTFRDGRLPHDQLDSATFCGGFAFSFWDERWVTVYPAESFSLTQPLVNYDLSAIAPDSFICLDTPQTENNLQVSAGLYLRTKTNTLHRYDNGLWIEITQPEERNIVFQYVDNPILVEYDRLRLRQNNLAKLQMFEYRKQDDTWAFINWTPDVFGFAMEIDHWQQIVLDDNQLWSATKAGFLPIEWGNRTFIDMDDITLIPKSPDCFVTDMRQVDTQTLFRCNFTSNTVFTGILSRSQDQSVFVPLADDPFASDDLVGAQGESLWYWQRVNQTGGNDGRLEGEILLNGSTTPEMISMLGSRFRHDDLTTISLFTPETIELASKSGGWYQAPHSSLAVSSLIRPISQTAADTVANVNSIRIGYNPSYRPEDDVAGQVSNRLLLCLEMTDGRIQTLTRSGEGGEGECPEFMAFDSLWLYEQRHDDRLLIIAPDSNGVTGERLLMSGRFNDDIVIGLPQFHHLPSLNSSCDIDYWLPTQAGVLGVNSEFKKCGLYTPPYTGLIDDELPTTLSVVTQPSTDDTLSEHSIVFYGGEQLVSLLDNRPAYEQSFPLTDGVVPIAIQTDESGITRIRFERESQMGWTNWNPATGNRSDNQYVFDDVSLYPAYSVYQQQWGSPPSTLTINYDYENFYLSLGDNQGQPLNFPLDDLIDIVFYDDYLYIITQHATYLLDVNMAMIEAFSP
jgi:hypothetical protein